MAKNSCHLNHSDTCKSGHEWMKVYLRVIKNNNTYMNDFNSGWGIMGKIKPIWSWHIGNIGQIIALSDRLNKNSYCILLCIVDTNTRWEKIIYGLISKLQLNCYINRCLTDIGMLTFFFIAVGTCSKIPLQLTASFLNSLAQVEK